MGGRVREDGAGGAATVGCRGWKAWETGKGEKEREKEKKKKKEKKRKEKEK